uniref:Pyridine nucleotide-disulfide oxidoreductase domain-containing protein 1 n=1 Tax=Arion vulgaris TaxID=1028688 RepID=A0A0B6YTZ6_9EUPU
MSKSRTRYVVVGGGISGVTCAETLSFLDKDARITLVSASSLIKTVINLVKVTQVGEMFDVEERSLQHAQDNCSNVTVVHASVTSLSTKEKKLVTSGGQIIEYDKLCVCTGAKPKVIAKDNPYVVGIRDTESVKDFQKKVSSARRIVVVGNGGIATELVYELEGCEVIWAIKDKSIAHTFVDAGAGEFFLEQLNKDKVVTQEEPLKRHKYTADGSHITTNFTSETEILGGALGPDWTSSISIHGAQQIYHKVHVETQVEVVEVLTPTQFRDMGHQEVLLHQHIELPQWPAYIHLSNKKVYGCDLIVSATGVEPFTDMFLQGNQFELAADGGLKVNDRMETTERDVYAAGDVCSASWEWSSHWLQMRLWSQARQMGCYAAKCMVASTRAEEISLDFCFEIFVHVTTFFKFKVILLGRFNAQGLTEDYELLLRVTKGQEYVKVILQDGKMVGAILIGETDLEETFENLILNGMDLTSFKENLLEPGVDVDDFFD